MRTTGLKLLMLLASAGIALSACDYTETPVPVSQVITGISTTTTTFVADGKSPIQITVTLPAGTADGKENVSFLTSASTFTESEKNSVTVPATVLTTADGVRTAYATLISPATEGEVRVLVTAQKFTKEHKLTFGRAYPESIRVTTSTLNLKTTPDSEATLTIELNRAIGIPTAKQPVTLTVTKTGDTTPLNGFRNKILFSDATGKCVNYFSVSDPSLIGQKLTVVATTKDAQGKDLSSDPIILTVIPN